MPNQIKSIQIIHLYSALKA